MMPTRTLAILLFDDVEVLDFCRPFEVFSVGIAAGIDMSLHVVGRLQGQEVAEKTTWHMEYPWQPTV